MNTKYIFLLSVLGILLVGGIVVLFLNRQGNIVLQEDRIISSTVPAERIVFITTDQVGIVGDWYQPDDANGKAVVLLHMMNRDRQSWVKFAQFLSSAGYGVLAIDLRGHGESISQKVAGENITLDYRMFTDAEHQSSIADVLAALNFVADEKSIARENIMLVGASIGANLALQTLQSDPQITAAVLLSPGLDYRGINASALVSRLEPEQRLFMIASETDVYSANSIQKLSNIASAQVTTRIFTNPQTGHGTDMFKTEEELSNMILKWLAQ